MMTTIEEVVTKHALFIETKNKIDIVGLVTRSALHFVHITDHTDAGTLQLVLKEKPENKLHKGTRIRASGVLVKPDCAKSKESYELICESISILGPIKEPDTYLPSLPQPKLSMDAWRSRPSERVACPSIRLKLKIADYVQYQLTEISQQMQAVRADPSEITSADCEGAGEMFTVTTAVNDDGSLEADKIIIPSKNDLLNLIYSLQAETKEQTQQHEIIIRKFMASHVKIQPEKDHFRKPHMAKLTVSSQLGLERLVKYMPFVWTMNKSFRAEQSDTNRHLAEFVHFEMEKANITYAQLMDMIEHIVVRVFMSLCQEKSKGLRLLQALEKIDPEAKGVLEKLKRFASKPFIRISYVEALAILNQNEAKVVARFPNVKHKFPTFGDDLGSSCERYLSEIHFQHPLFVTDMPWLLKSFYMKRSEDGQTVQGVDLLIPYMGELVGGSIREEDWSQMVIQLVEKRLYTTHGKKATDTQHKTICDAFHHNAANHKQDETKETKQATSAIKTQREPYVKAILKQYEIDFGTCSDYLALRKNAAVQSGGFGLGFARLVNICTTGEGFTGLVRDTIAEPVAWKYLES